MARRPSKHTRPARPLNTARYATKRDLRAGVFLFRDVSADRAAKRYTCPGCNNPIHVGTAHIVAWPEEPSLGFDTGVEERRHWHQHCWRQQR
ncbi:MAG: hypothetical protein Q4D79_00900 [Propionibacteriaceae bacterium]|nr:hypothetical protein [Propionibacteriaceae bacterium]